MDPQHLAQLPPEQLMQMFQQLQQQLEQQAAALQHLNQQQQQPARTHAPKVSLPKPFTGSFRSDALYNVEQWKLKMKLHFTATNITDPYVQTSVAVTLLEGDALQWWSGKMVQMEQDNIGPLTWTEFQQQITERFHVIEEKKIAMDKILSIRQTHSVAEYCADFQTLTNLCHPDISEPFAIQLFIRGLRQRHQAMVMTKNPTTLQQAMTYSQQVENVERSVSSHTIRYVNSHATAGQTHRYHQQQQHRPHYSSAPSNSYAPMDLSHVKEEYGMEDEQERMEADGDEEAQLHAMYRPPPRPPVQNRPSSFRPRHERAVHAQRRAQRLCYECASPNHFGRDCPVRAAREAAASGVKPKNA